MENKQGKVTATSFKKEWTGQFGTMFDHDVEFANGDKGVYTSKSKDQDKFKVGEEVSYTIEKKDRNGYVNFVIKPVVENKGNGFGGKNFAPRNHKADAVAFAMSYTKDLIVAGKLDLKDLEKNFNRMHTLMANKLDEVNKPVPANEPVNAN